MAGAEGLEPSTKVLEDDRREKHAAQDTLLEFSILDHENPSKTQSAHNGIEK